jgi:hypothetical protein
MQTPAPKGPDAIQLRMLQLCSRGLDHDLSSREKTELNGLKNQFPEMAARFESDALGLGGLMRGLPTGEVPVALRKSVRRRIRNSEPVATRHTEQAQPASRSRSRRLVAFLSLSTLAACMLAAVLLRPFDPVDDFAALSSAGRLSDATEVGQPAAESNRAGVQLPGQPPIAGSAPAMVLDNAAGVISQGDNWQVVVLRISSDDRDAIEKQIEMVASQSGLEVTSRGTESAADSESNPYEFIYATAPVKSREFVNAMVDSGLAGPAEWNPAMVANMDREDLIARIRSSMASPSNSELHFGRMFVVIPNDQSSANDDATQENPDGVAAGRPKPQLAAADHATEQPGSQVATTSDKARDVQGDAESVAAELLPESPSESQLLAARTDSDRKAAIVDSDSELVKTAPQSNHYLLVVLDFTNPRGNADCDSDAVPL